MSAPRSPGCTCSDAFAAVRAARGLGLDAAHELGCRGLVVSLPCPVPISPTAPDGFAVERDLVMHAPDRSGATALCERPTSPGRILASGPIDAIDCPTCVERIATSEGLEAATHGAAEARRRLRAKLAMGPRYDSAGLSDEERAAEEREPRSSSGDT